VVVLHFKDVSRNGWEHPHHHTERQSVQSVSRSRFETRNSKGEGRNVTAWSSVISVWLRSLAIRSSKLYRMDAGKNATQGEICRISLHYTQEDRPSLWPSGQSFWLQIHRFGLDSRCYQIFWEVVGLERGPLRFVSTTEELLERNRDGYGLERREYGHGDPSRWLRVPFICKSWH
jgi:hypothetical protein